MQSKNIHHFSVNDKKFEIEYFEFVINNTKVSHIEFYQIINNQKSQNILDNLSHFEAIQTFNFVINLTHQIYGNQIVVFSSLDSNKKRTKLYSSIIKKCKKLFKTYSKTIYFNCAVIFLLSKDSVKDGLAFEVVDYLNLINYLSI